MEDLQPIARFEEEELLDTVNKLIVGVKGINEEVKKLTSTMNISFISPLPSDVETEGIIAKLNEVIDRINIGGV